MTDFERFNTWLQSATRPAIRVVRANLQRLRREHPEQRCEGNALLRRITQELAARGEYDHRMGW
jgi:hypothetical protein